jgi:CRP-like cAMP-binding protein
MYSLLQHQEFQDGDYIIRQGDVGDKFYIITGGAADVIEESFDGFYFRRDVLTRLYEGHFFGEMAIIYDEPRCVVPATSPLCLHHILSDFLSCRVASVVAVGRTSCLYLSKAAFREALSTQQFHMMMQVGQSVSKH